MKIIAIVAADKHYGIGKDNKMPWHLPEDFRFFKRKTMGHAIIMGRNTFESIGRPLPGRENVIISSSMENKDGVTVVRSITEALRHASDQGHDKAFIIGGGTIYLQTQDLWDEIFFTSVDTIIPDATVFFPNIDERRWKMIWGRHHSRDAEHAYDYSFQHWVRRDISSDKE